ncbi:uncharacterized protein B0T15DRAFT_500167 [Chaetomium strumarium]|uniref:Peptidase S8/S53 domain-containing protein n=1 Tax=Chaetomium strumarium TaxID=1170767 RepID=A0AAJ0M465_9PEZI|nr:hypothetical protein B0T15DRAFT_500167 [Chaetomium strumarium]
MASTILRVCPMVKIYPIRLRTFGTSDGRTKIDADYAAQAIQAALDKKATILCMLWTIPMTEGENQAKKRLHDVLRTAVERRILMFCSASDEGKFSELDYPSGPWRDRFIRIGAAGADGTAFQWSADDGITYVLLGVDVTVEQVTTGSHDASFPMKTMPPNRMNEYSVAGSSVATALAVGLAAMILYCVKASILAIRTATQDSNGSLLGLPPDNAAQLMAHPDEMRRAFASLGNVTPNNFVQVWDELDKVSEQLEVFWTPSSTPEVKQKCVEAFVDFGLKLWNAAMEEH